MPAQTRTVTATLPAPPGGWATGNGYLVAELTAEVEDTSTSPQQDWSTDRRYCPANAAGFAKLVLVCNDDPALTPQGTLWRIWTETNGQLSPINTYDISTSLPATADLSTLSTTSSPGPTPTIIDGGAP